MFLLLFHIFFVCADIEGVGISLSLSQGYFYSYFSEFFGIKSIGVLVLTHELGEVDILPQKQGKNQCFCLYFTCFYISARFLLDFLSETHSKFRW